MRSHTGTAHAAARAVVFAAGLLLPASASAQGTSYTRVSLTTSQIHDSNLFGAPTEDRTSDLILRFGPLFETGYRSPSFDIDGRYGADADRYAYRPSFNAALARQDASLRLRRSATRRMSLAFGASYLSTQTPHELNLESGLLAGRARASRLTAGPTLEYDWGPRTKLTSAYDFARDTLAGGIAATVHRARLEIVRRQDRRTTRRVEYRFRAFEFGGTSGRSSHVLVVGWERAITRGAGIDLVLGPRLSGGDIRPEIAAAFRVQSRQAHWTLGYSRTETTAIGERGTFDVQRVAVEIAYAATRDLSFTAAPALFSLERDAGRASIFALDVEASHRATPLLSFSASARVSRQRGPLAGGFVEVPSRTLSVKTTVRFPRTPRGSTTRTR